MLETLASDLEAVEEERNAAFLLAVFALYAALKDRDARAPTLAATLAGLGLTGFREAFTLSGTVQLRYLRRRFSLETLSERAATPYGRLVQRRVQLVLAREQSEVQLQAYARLLNSVSTNFGARAGFETVGTQAGATKKTFTRFRSARENRPHSRLEGLTIGRNENFLIDGFSVPAPADPKLPLSSRLRCGHCALYRP